MSRTYEIRPITSRKIWSFYRNVAKKYKHTFAQEDIVASVRKAVRSILNIETTLSRRKPTIARWQRLGYHMAYSGHWYYAYTIDGDTITIQDACHEQNMHD